MELGSETLERVGQGIDALAAGCRSLTDTLNHEAQALGHMDLPSLNTWAMLREEGLETIIAADASLRKTLAEASAELNIPPELILKEGPLAAALAPRRQALISERERLHAANIRVRTRANHGLAFFRSSLGPVDSYGAQGECADLGPSSVKFYRVM